MAKSVKDILNMDYLDVAKLSRSELAKVVSQMSSAANKRLRRLEKTEMGTLSYAYQKVQQVGDFSVKGKTHGQLQKEFKRAKNFLTSKTSSVGGWRRERAKVRERIGGGFSSEEEEKAYWKAYREIRSEDPALHHTYGSTETQRELRREMNNPKQLTESEKDNFRRLFPGDNRDLDKLNGVELGKVRTMIDMGEDYEKKQQSADSGRTKRGKFFKYQGDES